MQLNETQKRHLRGLGHALKPLVRMGQHGLTDGVVRELDLTLESHELVKVQARVGDRGQRDGALAELAARTGAVLVQRVGNVGLLYRPSRERPPRIVLPAG